MGDLPTDEHDRPRPPQDGDEVSTLLGFLEAQRATFEWKCQNVDDEQLRALLPRSAVTLGGLLKHMAFVEDSWFTGVVAHEQTPEPRHNGHADLIRESIDGQIGD